MAKGRRLGRTEPPSSYLTKIRVLLKMRVFVVWEPILRSDFMAPTTGALRRIADAREASMPPAVVFDQMNAALAESRRYDYFAVALA